MSYMKCPFCNSELDMDMCGECGCINEQCQKSVFMFGSEELWQELIRTKKRLDIAVDALKNVQKNSPENYTATQAVFLLAKNSVFVNNALEQLTLPEQKDVK